MAHTTEVPPSISSVLFTPREIPVTHCGPVLEMCVASQWDPPISGAHNLSCHSAGPLLIHADRLTPSRWLKMSWQKIGTRPSAITLLALLRLQCHMIISRNMYMALYLFNSSPPSAPYMSKWIESALTQKMACRLFGAKPLSKPMLGYCQLDPWEQTSVKLLLHKTFNSRKFIWKCCLWNGGHFVRGGGCKQTSLERRQEVDFIPMEIKMASAL